MKKGQSKYREPVLSLVERETIKSTTQVQTELQEKSGKSINWHMVYKILNDLAEKGLVKRFENNAGLFWTKV